MEDSLGVKTKEHKEEKESAAEHEKKEGGKADFKPESEHAPKEHKPHAEKPAEKAE